MPAFSIIVPVYNAQKTLHRCLNSLRGQTFSDFEVLMIAEKMGYSVSEYPVTIVNHRESKINLVKDACRMMKDVRSIRKRVKRMKF